MRIRGAFVLLGAYLVVALATFPGGPARAYAARPPAQPAAIVNVGNFWFCDTGHIGQVCSTTVTAGDAVEWRWVAYGGHTVTECAGDLGACPEPHLWDSGPMAAGSFVFTFDTPGTYVYRCQLHPTLMLGSVTVLAAAPTPSPEPSPAPPPTLAPSPVPAESQTTPQTVASATASPQASPPAAMPTPAAQPSAVPSGGAVPPADGGATLSWLAVVGGGMMVAAAAVIAARGLRRRDA